MFDRKTEIRRTAARLFRKKGYGAVSVRDIAEGVGIKAASIYNHFASKQDLLCDLLLTPARLFTAGMQAVKLSALDSPAQLRALIQLHVRLAVESTDAVALLTAEWTHLEGEARSEFFRLREEYENDFTAIIERGKAEGFLKSEADTEIIVFSLLSTLRWLPSWYGRRKNLNVSKLEGEISKTLLEGIVKPNE